jgi:hypothetical protein
MANYQIVRGYVLPISEVTVPRRARARKRKPSKKIPKEVLEPLTKAQRTALRAKIRAAGGWNADRACEVIKGPRRKTWANTKKYAEQLANEHGIDWRALDPASSCFRDGFCGPLELKGKKCPDTQPKGGWGKAARIGLGSKSRRFDKLRDRPQFQVLREALSACEGIDLAPTDMLEAEDHQAQVERCKEGHAEHTADLLAETRKGKPPKPPKREKVPF